MPKFLVLNSMQGLLTSTLLYLNFHLLEEVHQRSLQLHFPAIDDTLPELTEGFIYYLVVVNSQLDPRDVGRIDFFNQFTSVRIQDNDCEPQFKGLYPFLFILPVILCM